MYKAKVERNKKKNQISKKVGSKQQKLLMFLFDNSGI